MASRVARALASSSPSIPRIPRSEANSTSNAAAGRRWSSSNSSSPKPDKKLKDRLSDVIDAVNERKLPPELRGRRGAVRKGYVITGEEQQNYVNEYRYKEKIVVFVPEEKEGFNFLTKAVAEGFTSLTTDVDARPVQYNHDFRKWPSLMLQSPLWNHVN